MKLSEHKRMYDLLATAAESMRQKARIERDRTRRWLLWRKVKELREAMEAQDKILCRLMNIS